MSSTTPYRVQVAGFLANTSSTTEPSLTNPALNEAFKNQLVDANGAKYFVDSTGKAVKLENAPAAEFDSLVYFNGNDPTTATVFDDVNPPVSNDPALPASDKYMYVGANGKTWTYKPATNEYVSYEPAAVTEWYLNNTFTDAKGEKTTPIWRSGKQMGLGGFALPDSNVTMYQNGDTKGLTLTGTPLSFPQTGNGARWILGVNLNDNVQYWFGDYNGVQNNILRTGYDMLRCIHVKNEVVVVDAVAGNGAGGTSPTDMHIGQAFVGIGAPRPQTWTGRPLYNAHVRGTFGVDTLPTYNTATQVLVKNPTTQQVGVRDISGIQTSVGVTPGDAPFPPNGQRTISTVTVNGTPTEIKETTTTLFVNAALTGPTVAVFYNEESNPTEIPGLNVLAATQPTPTATGNTTNLNSVFKDAAGDTWVVDAGGDAIKAGAASAGAAVTTTSLTPKVYQGSAYVNAQANTDVNVADLLSLSDGSQVHDGKVTWTGHGLTVGAWYYLSQTTAGAYTTVRPTSGLVQQLFFVEDANTIHVDIEEAWTVASQSGSPGQDFAKTVYFDTTTPSTATIFDEANPPVTNDDALKADSANVYIGSDNSMWTYDATAAQYETYVVPTSVKAIFRGRWASVVNISNGNYAASLTAVNINTYPSAWNNSTGTYTAPKAGYYLLAGSIAVQNQSGMAAGVFAELYFEKNGVVQFSGLDQNPSNNSGTFLSAVNSGPVYLALGDTVRFRFGTNGGTLQTHVASTHFSISEL